VQTLREGPSRSSRGGAAAQAGRALGALVPALGLSNKAVYAEDAEGAPGAGGGASAQGPAYPEGPDLAPAAAPAAVAGAPLEAHLAASTLWPEIVKLYGHAGEVSALAADPRGRFLASACRARPPAPAPTGRRGHAAAVCPAPSRVQAAARSRRNSGSRMAERAWCRRSALSPARLRLWASPGPDGRRTRDAGTAAHMQPSVQGA